jgi:NADH-quinone oxidoreductase subunit G
VTDQHQDVSTVSVTVNGKEIEARKGELVIAAAERNDVYIPRFCWHNRMNPVGMCRMCLVEVDTGRGPALQPSCMIECTDGMSVETETPTVVKAQEGVLEFLLINHPLDCPVCDKGGECPLQDQTMSHGPGESRYVEEKRHKEKPIPVSGLVTLDRERCILCDRCTRFAKEVAGDAFVHFMERGNQSEINTFPDHPFAPYFSGNTVQLCPVGALTSTAYRFKARPWDLAQVESTCTGCSVGCRIVVDSSRDEVLRYHGVDSEPVNWSWLCDRGRYGFEAIERGERLTEPLQRDGEQGETRQVRWSDALAASARAIRDGLDRSGPEGLAFLGGANLTNEAQFVWSKLAKGVLGTDNVDAQLDDGLDPRLVLGLPRATIAETCTPGGTILVVANDVKEELGVLFLRLRHAAVWDGATVIEISATDTGVTDFAAASLRARPGQSPALLQALLSGGTAPDGVDADAFTVARDRLGANGPLRVVLGRPSLAESADVVTLAAHKILAARPDATFLTTLRRGNVYGAIDMGLTPGLLPGRVTLADGRNAVAAGWGIAANELPSTPGLDARGILEAAANGKIDTLVLLGADPIADFGDRALAERALAGARTVISVDIFPNESNRLADVVLPAAGFTAEDGTTTNLEGRVTRVAQKVTAPGSAHADWIIAAELAFALRADLGLETLEAVRAEIARTAPSHAGLTEALLDGDADGTIFPIPAEVAPAEAAADDEPVASADDAPEAQTSEAADASAADGDATEPAAESEPAAAARTTTVPAIELPPEPGIQIPTLDAYSFRLVVTRKMYDQGTLVQQAPHLAPLATAAGQVPVRLNPADVARLGLDDGAMVKVTSARGSIAAAAVADDGVPRGIAAFVFDQSPGGAQSLVDPSQPVTDVHVETRS